MGLKNFLKQQGFIEDDKKPEVNPEKINNPQRAANTVAPTYFPLPDETEKVTDSGSTEDPSFVTPLQKTGNASSAIDPTFVKFFEDELAKANLHGPD